MLFRFLCVLWGYSSNHGDQLDVRVGAVLQTQALYMGRALLSAQSAATLEQLAAADSPGEKLKPDPAKCLNHQQGHELTSRSVVSLQLASYQQRDEMWFRRSCSSEDEL